MILAGSEKAKATALVQRSFLLKGLDKRQKAM